MTGEVAQGLLREHVGDPPHSGVGPDFPSIRRGNAGTFLSAVLESKEGKKSKTGYILIRGINAKNSARLVQD
jgi:hypothetical protein